MKIFVWLLAIIIYGVISAIFSIAGISLGAIPTALLIFVLFVPAHRISKTLDIKKYKKKFPQNITSEMNGLILSYKNDFITKNNIGDQDDGVDIFEVVRNSFIGLNTKEIEEMMIEIAKSNESPASYVLERLRTEAYRGVRNGKISEIVQQNGKTYTAFLIYKYIMNAMLECGEISSSEYKEAIDYIEEYIRERIKSDD